MPKDPQYAFQFGGQGDYSDPLAVNQHIEFYHLVSGKHVLFKAFVTNFEDTFDSQWNEEDAYGRMDPISTYKRTGRKISLSWDVPASSYEESQENLRKISLLMSMLYPSYEKMGPDVNIIKSSPIFKLKFMNMVSQHAVSGLTSSRNGLLGYINGNISYKPDFESAGSFYSTSPRMLYPKLVKMSCNFTVLHQHPLGWDENGNQRQDFDKFPYAIQTNDVFDRDAVTLQAQSIQDQNNLNINRSTQERNEAKIDNKFFQNKGTVTKIR